jgi:hypothetical protein
MTSVVVECAIGTVEVDLDEDEVVDDSAAAVPPARPPLVVSNDGGLTWREAGAGLRPGVAVVISPDHPDLVVYATAERLHVSRDGGRFWTALTVELPEITSVAFAR